ncbi:hypothetical protein Hypma_007270 [Hypsizygus marmoreus]|uniref:F-box domain-containing protein n=1 Tax=Hypsizygus marmoreus TaxID=39966 RepID=A0A369KH95_HYPMA|nr:hypothetical protein Hypma_007270 [Hypsizygus marmoreus]
MSLQTTKVLTYDWLTCYHKMQADPAEHSTNLLSLLEKPNKSGTAHLPIELIMAIFSFLSDDDLPPIFASSKLFNHLALLTLYTNHIVQSPYDTLHIVSRNVLRNLRLALTLSSIKHVSFKATSDSDILRDISSLYRFFSLHHVHGRIPHVELDFGRDVCSSADPAHILPAMQSLLSIITGSISTPVIRLSSCRLHTLPSSQVLLLPELHRYTTTPAPRTTEDLTADHRGEVLAMALFSVVMIYPAWWRMCVLPLVFILIRHVFGFFRRIKPRTTVVSVGDRLEWIQAVERLQELHIVSPQVIGGKEMLRVVVFDPPSQDFLEMGPEALLDEAEWGAVLRCIRLPSSLTGLFVYDKNIAMDDLFAWVAHHPLVSEVTYTPTIFHNTPKSIPTTILPNVVSIAASPEFIEFVHTHTTGPGDIFPHLTHLEFISPRSQFRLPDVSNRALRALTMRHSPIDLDLSTARPWLSSGTELEEEYTVPCVKELSLFWPPPVAAVALIAWLRRFPCLERLTLVDPELSTREGKMAAFRELRVACPKLRTVLIGTVERSLEGWIAEFALV